MSPKDLTLINPISLVVDKQESGSCVAPYKVSGICPSVAVDALRPEEHRLMVARRLLMLVSTVLRRPTNASHDALNAPLVNVES